MLIQTVSSFDYAHENFYHGFMLGLCAIMNNLYRVDSNKESGAGRYDIQLMPMDKAMPGVVIELKVIRENIAENHVTNALKEATADALSQIDQKQYTTQMRRDGITRFMKIGAVFYKKNVEIAYAEE